MPIFKQYEVVVVPFPFTDAAPKGADRRHDDWDAVRPRSSKRRPALVLSDSSSFKIDKSILAMITSSSHQPWPLDAEIENPSAAGLRSPSMVRMKLFTLDNSLIVKSIGRLSDRDREKISFNLLEVFRI